MPGSPSGNRLEHPRDIRDLATFRVAMLAFVIEANGQDTLSRHYGITLGDWRVLGLLGALAPVTQAALVAHSLMDKAQLSRIVTSLAARGLVHSARDLANRRTSVLRLTEAGRALHDAVLAGAGGRNALLLQALSDEERHHLDTILGKLQDRAEAMRASASLAAA